MKNQRTLESLYNKLDTELAKAKIEADAVAQKVRLNLALIKDYPDYNFLFSDIQPLAYKEFDELKILVESRIDAHQKAEESRLEQERERIRLEEKAKLERIRAEEIRAEEEAKAKREIETKLRYEQSVEKERRTRSEEAQAVIDEKRAIISESIQAQELGMGYDSRPPRGAIIEVVAHAFGVGADTAEGWLFDEFNF
jgi:flagellar biosynthesis GTPase FlhF